MRGYHCRSGSAALVGNSFVTGQEEKCMKMLRLVHHGGRVFVVLRSSTRLRCACAGYVWNEQNTRGVCAACSPGWHVLVLRRVLSQEYICIVCLGGGVY